MSHPRDWPTVPCPQCGKGALLTYGMVACEVIDCPGPAVRIYGDARDGIVIPVHLRDDPEPMAFCNSSGCRWVGPLKQAKTDYGCYKETEEECESTFAAEFSNKGFKDDESRP